MLTVREITEINGKKFAILVNDNDMTAYEAVEIDGKWEIDFDYPSIGVDSFDVACALDFEGTNKAGYRFTDGPRPMIKVREIIKFKGWVNGSGWSYTETYSDNIVDVTEVPMTAEEYDWDWYETPEENPEAKGRDTLIIVKFYAEDTIPNYDNPITAFSKWESEIWKKRNT